LALSLEPRLLPAYEGLILALERQGRLKEAREWRARLADLQR
jgi:hypothetical protein